MSKFSAEDQFKFLICCVKNSNNGKIDFATVTEQCSIVTKGAAAKRYERLLKANDIPNGESSGGPGTPPVNPTKPPASRSTQTTTSSKGKRKTTDTPAVKKRKTNNKTNNKTAASVKQEDEEEASGDTIAAGEEDEGDLNAETNGTPEPISRGNVEPRRSRKSGR